jgi:N-acetyl-beta-hexosaminidase
MSSGFYFDKQKPDPSDPDRYLWVDTWKDMYLNEPFTLVTNEENQKLILGIEGAMWGEQVDHLNIESRVWPRLSAVAERAWSLRSVSDAEAAQPRLINHICKTMVKRGVRSGMYFTLYTTLYILI